MNYLEKSEIGQHFINQISKNVGKIRILNMN